MNNKNKFVIENGVLVKYPGAGIEEAFLDEPISIKDDAGEITSVIIPEGVTSIGESAFSGCTGLTGIDLPNSLSVISSWAFLGCKGLKSLTIPRGVTEINGEAFSGCSGLTSIEVSDDNKAYYSENNCIIERGSKKLVLGCKNSIIPDDVTAIGEHAFDGCIELKSIVIPESVTKIEKYSFCGCEGLETVVIPKSVTEIGSAMYWGRLDGNAFCDCTGLTSVVISEGVTKIGDFTFSGCTGLVSVVIPEGVTEIGGGTFAECTALESVALPKSLKKIGSCVFRDSGVETVTYAGTRSEFNAIERTEWNIKSKIATVVCLGGEDVEISEHDQWLELITQDNAQELENAPEHILADKDFMIKAVKRNGFALAYASDELKNDAEVVLDAINSDDEWGYSAKALEFASDELKDDKSIVMTAVSRYGVALCFASDRLRCDRDVVMAAVDQSGWALEYASDELRNDEEVVLTAIQGWDGVSCNYSFAMKYASKELKSNKEFMIKAIELTEGEAFAKASDALKNDKEIVLIAVKNCSPPHQCDTTIVLAYASDQMRADKDVVLAAVRRNGWSLNYASEELKADRDVVLVATINNPWSLTYASPALRADKEFMMYVVKAAGTDPLKYASAEIRNDKDILRAAQRYMTYKNCGDEPLYEFYGLNSIIIPENVTEFHPWTFFENVEFRKNIESITVEEGNTTYHCAGNCLIETESKTLVLGCKNSVIPDDGSVERIGYQAFAGCEGLTSLHIPASITSISDAFGGGGGFLPCRDLEHITVSPDNKCFYSINDEILIGKGNDVDGECVIYACKNVKNFHFSAKMSFGGGVSFAACSELESLTVDQDNPWLYSVNNCVIDKKYGSLIGACKNSVIPYDGSIKSIGLCAFSGVKLMHLHIPAYWDRYAIMDGSDGYFPLDGIIVTESITVADDNKDFFSINNCLVGKENKYLYLASPNSLIPDDGSVETVGGFSNHTELTSITIPSCIERIDDMAFLNCNNLETVILGSGVNAIGSCAFANCNNLSTVFYCGTQSDKENIFIEQYYEPINFATWYYYSEEKPEEEGNYWHYVDGEPTVW